MHLDLQYYRQKGKNLQRYHAENLIHYFMVSIGIGFNSIRQKVAFIVIRGQGGFHHLLGVQLMTVTAESKHGMLLRNSIK